MAKPAVILVGADKGGVGKTTVSRALLDYFIAHNIPTRAFDTESPKGTLKRFHPDVTEVVDMHSTADQMKIFDTLSSADARLTVIDIRAGLLSTTLRALLDYFVAHNIPIRAFDTESPKGTLKRFHPDVTEVVDMHSTADQMKIFDTLSSADARLTV
ncbi:MAG: hypothetical protein QOF91_254, partial [Alphaproteobacteria bacterium]|nr:hypothetical protein [Alphaproteobacteria bacterium]